MAKVVLIKRKDVALQSFCGYWKTLDIILAVIVQVSNSD